MVTRLVRLALTVMSLAVFLSVPAGADILYSCPGGGSGDGIWRGFYVENYKGTALGTVALSYHTNQDVGSYTVSLTAHEGAFDGPVIGTAEVVFDETGIEALFDFHDAPVTEGVTVAFVQSLVSGPEGAVVYYYVGSCGLDDESCSQCPGIVETDGYDPPLSSFRRGSVGLTITGTASTPSEMRTWGRLRMIYR